MNSFKSDNNNQQINNNENNNQPGMIFSTGTAAAAAALAATMVLAGKSSPSELTIITDSGNNSGIRVKIDMAIMLNSDEAMAIVTKDAKGAPDIADGAEVGAIVRRRSEPHLIQIIGGLGVGKVTRPGLAVPPGEWAIYPAPRQMISENLHPLLGSPDFPGAEVEIFVEKGEALAAKTLNHRLGIVGGISILDNSGTARPFSHEAYIATIETALDIAKSGGLEHIVFCPGAQSEKIAISLNPYLPSDAFIMIDDFFADSLKLAAAKEFKKIQLNLFFDRAVKLAFGISSPQFTETGEDMMTLADWLDPAQGELNMKIKKTKNFRLAFDILCESNALDKAALIAEKAAIQASSFINPEQDLELIILHYEGYVIARS